ncbi:MAG TPA: porin [Chitinophagaceae bacterium]|nr:porin [Chitinophagaceae bacterium]
MKKNSKLRFDNFFFVLVMLLSLTFDVSGQDSAPSDSGLRNRDKTGKKLDFNETDFGFTTARVGAAFMNDWAWYSQDAKGKAQLDSANVELKDQSKWRDARIFFSGKIKSKRYLEWRVAMMWDGVEEEFTFRETGLIIGMPELSGKIFIGRSKVGFSSSKVENGYACPAIERQPALDPIPIMTDGIRYFGATKKSNLFWSAGISSNLIYGNDSRFMPYEWIVAGRFGGLPLYKPEQNTWIHLGMNFFYAKPVGDKIQVKSRPESNPAPYFIDTKPFDCNKVTAFGPELYFYSGPMMIGSESFVYNYQSKQAGNPAFWGGNILITYNLTGESYPYIKDNAVSYFVEPKKSFFKGGPGCWQVLFTGTIYDTNNDLMPGGNMWKLTGMLNWYPSNDFAIKFMYGYGELDRFGIKGATQYFQTRFQINIM